MDNVVKKAKMIELRHAKESAEYFRERAHSAFAEKQNVELAMILLMAAQNNELLVEKISKELDSEVAYA